MSPNCPTCAAPIESELGICQACARSGSNLASGSVPPESAPGLDFETSRRDERFAVPTDVLLRKLSPGGECEKEERTIAHDLSRHGMRLLTSWSDLETGDKVALEEVGGGFSTQAVVRHVRLGTDRITRVGVEFVGSLAPDRLVGTTTGLARPVFDSSRSSPGPTRADSPPVTRPGNLPPASRPVAPAAQTASVPRPSRPTQPPNPPVAAPRSAADVREEVEALCATAREMVGESRIWESLDCLAKAGALAEGTPQERAIRVLTCETQARVPSLMRAAQQTLQDLARTEPEDATVHLALGRIFWRAGLSARARGAFSRVRDLDPLNREAAAALAALAQPAHPR